VHFHSSPRPHLQQCPLISLVEPFEGHCLGNFPCSCSLKPVVFRGEANDNVVMSNDELNDEPMESESDEPMESDSKRRRTCVIFEVVPKGQAAYSKEIVQKVYLADIIRGRMMPDSMMRMMILAHRQKHLYYEQWPNFCGTLRAIPAQGMTDNYQYINQFEFFLWKDVPIQMDHIKQVISKAVSIKTGRFCLQAPAGRTLHPCLEAVKVFHQLCSEAPSRIENELNGQPVIDIMIAPSACES
jgi:hypothetical protein